MDWNAFTPGSALLGGLMIGGAAAMFVLLNGRIAGISGVIGGLLGTLRRRQRGDAAWRLAFIVGLLAAPAVLGLVYTLPTPRIAASTASLIVAGLLVGFGTRLGSGCTSGHGVCGLARLSPRSLAATLLFIGAGFATVFVLRHAIP
jgi:uncharacterized protein